MFEIEESGGISMEKFLLFYYDILVATLTKEGGNFANKDAYIIFYKDGAISYIMFNSNYVDNSDDPENKDHAVIYFYTRYVDYDSYEIYY